MTLLAFENVSKSYGASPAITNVSLEIPAGKIVGLLGPNGSGKTTLINLLARFWDVHRGKVTLGGVDVKDYDMDAFYASIEINRNPKLKNKALVVGENIVTTASYEARKYGIHSAMSLAQAKNRCPNLVIVEPKTLDIARVLAPFSFAYFIDIKVSIVSPD